MKAFWSIGTAAVLLLGSAVGSASADDLVPAPWRTDPVGEAPTTYQAWEFSTDANPSAPDVDLNPFGVASAEVIYSSPFKPWIPSDYGHQGVWYVEDYIQLIIPNNPDPNEQKLIWLQLTYYADGAGDAQIFTDPQHNGTIETIAKDPLDDWYTHATYKITIEPNPAQEIIALVPRDCTLYVDEIVVETICTPEPTAALLVLLPLAVLLRRR